MNSLRPEEKIRQALLRQMLGPLSFPKGLVSVEMSLFAQRRADIVVYSKKGDTLEPLLLVECKHECVDEAAEQQVLGYNWSLLAPFWCLAHARGIRTYWKEGGEIKSVGFLPPYPQLLLRVMQGEEKYGTSRNPL